MKRIEKPAETIKQGDIIAHFLFGVRVVVDVKPGVRPGHFMRISCRARGENARAAIFATSDPVTVLVPDGGETIKDAEKFYY